MIKPAHNKALRVRINLSLKIVITNIRSIKTLVPPEQSKTK